MSTPRWRWCPAERRGRALTFLAQLCVRSAGYRLRGVYGWAHPHDLVLLAGTSEWAALLACQAAAGSVCVQDASVSGVGPPALLYRITQAGMDKVAGVLRERAPSVVPPVPWDGTDGVYASHGARRALQALGAVPSGNWLGIGAIQHLAEESNRAGERRLVFMSDIDELVSSGLAEARIKGVGQRATTYYRVTVEGRAVKLLEWFGWDPEAPIYSDHDGVRLLVSSPLYMGAPAMRQHVEHQSGTEAALRRCVDPAPLARLFARRRQIVAGMP